MKRYRIDLLAPPFSGHLNPIIAMARVLNKDYDVRIVSTPAVQKTISDAGIQSVQIMDGLDETLKSIVNSGYAIGGNPFRLHQQFRNVFVVLVRLKEELLNLYRDERPDLLISDFTLATVGLVADEYTIPWWTSLPSPCVMESRDAPPAYLGGWKPKEGILGFVRDSIGRQMIKIFKHSIAYMYRSDLDKIGFSSVYRDDGSESIYSSQCVLVLGVQQIEFRKQWPAAAAMIGPMLFTQSVSTEIPTFKEGKKHVLITMGTHLDWIKDEVASELERIARRFPDLEFHFTDGHVNVESYIQNQNFKRFSFIDYSSQIKKYDLVIHHGGSGVMYYCLREGKPSIVFPVDYDQFDNAARLEVAGLAYRIKKFEQIEEFIRLALNDQNLVDKCSKFSKILCSVEPEVKLKIRVAELLTAE